MLLQMCVIIAIYLQIIKSKLITCTDPSGCVWYCAANNNCNNIYNCTSTAPSCTLQCYSCNGTQIFSSSNSFDIICFSPNGCANNMEITTQTSTNRVHVYIASETNKTNEPSSEPTMEPSMEPTIYPTISPITVTTNDNNNIISVQQTITTEIKLNATNIINIVIAEDDSNNNNTFGTLTIFAMVLSGIFVLCVCIGIGFCIDTKRKSKLHKNSASVNSIEYGMVKRKWNAGNPWPHRIQQELKMRQISTANSSDTITKTVENKSKNSSYITPKPPPRRRSKNNEEIELKNKSFNSKKNDKYVNCALQEVDEEETDDEDTEEDKDSEDDKIRSNLNVVIDINGETVTKRTSVQNLINKYNKL